MRFQDRAEAGRALAVPLMNLASTDPVVVGLPRGGVPVAFEVARALAAPLDVLIVCKLGVPYQCELAMGAIGEDGVRVLNHPVLRACGVSAEELAEVEAAESVEVESRVRRYREGIPRVSLAGRTVIVVDDGMATGSSARAACAVARAEGATRVVLAVPVASAQAVRALQRLADEVVCLSVPDTFWAVGEAYVDFAAVGDEQIRSMLRAARGHAPVPFTHPSTPTHDQEELLILAGPAGLPGRLTVPPEPRGLVVFAHGSGSGRHSPRNRSVAQALHRWGLATLLFDLLGEVEERDGGSVFDVDLLAARLLAATVQVREHRLCRDLPVAYFGASTGAAAALAASADPAAQIAAVVSRSGRPDLAWPWLPWVYAPTLLIVGEHDRQVLELNRRAEQRLTGPTRLAVVADAGHLFEEPGALDRVGALATDWLLDHLAHARVPAAVG